MKSRVLRTRRKVRIALQPPRVMRNGTRLCAEHRMCIAHLVTVATAVLFVERRNYDPTGARPSGRFTVRDFPAPVFSQHPRVCATRKRRKRRAPFGSQRQRKTHTEHQPQHVGMGACVGISSRFFAHLRCCGWSFGHSRGPHDPQGT